MRQRVIILGAGVSGLAAAWRLSGRKVSVEVVEAAPALGGLAGSVREGPYCMDIGPHSFFSDDQEIVDTVLGLFEEKPQPLPRSVKFFYEGKYLDYPLTGRSVLFQMGLRSGLLSAGSFLKSKLFPSSGNPPSGEEETVEEWALSNFGEHLYRTFFKPYTEQFWKVPCSELSARSIPTHTRMSFTNTLRMLLHRKTGSGGESLIEREMRPTYYPDSGFAEITELMAEKVERGGGVIHREKEAVGAEPRPGGGMRVTVRSHEREEVIEGDHVISTIPLSRLVGIARPDAPEEVRFSAERLVCRALVVLGMVTEKQDVLGCGYTYLLNRPFNRIFEMNKFNPRTSPPGENIIAVEIPCLRESAAWRASKEELFDICIGSLAEDGFLAPGDVTQLLVARASHAYPIYLKDYAVHLDRVTAWLKTVGPLSTLGRAGEFMYMDIDECIKRAFALADRLTDAPGEE